MPRRRVASRNRRMVQGDAARQKPSPPMPISNPAPNRLTGFGIGFTWAGPGRCCRLGLKSSRWRRPAVKGLRQITLGVTRTFPPLATYSLPNNGKKLW